MHMTRRLTIAALGGVLALSLATFASGCAGGSAYGTNPYVQSNPTPSPSPSPSSSPSSCEHALAPAGTEIIGVDLSTSSCDDSTYGQILGYFGGSTKTMTQVVSITESAGDTVEFENVDSGTAHTANNLGTWTGSFPANGPSVPANPSPAGTDISAAGFTTGVLNPGETSPAYVADVPGIYVFGCAFHYSIGMRTVIIVQ